MKKKYLALLIVALIMIASVTIAIVNTRLESDRSVEYDYQADVDSVASFDRVLKFAGGTDFSPFCYIDENGNPCGHDVELAYAIGREMNCRVEITLGDWSEMQAGLLNGTYDVLMTVDYSDERSKIMGYTSPVCLDSYVYFAKDSDVDVSSIDSIKHLKIASLKGGGATDNYLRPMNLMNSVSQYSTQIAAFESVEKGYNDVAIAGYIYGSNIIAAQEMDLLQVGSPLYGSAYYFTYAKGNVALGPELNSALANLEATGILTEIDEKWTTHYQPNLTLKEFLERNMTTVLIIALAVLLFAIIIASILRGRVRRREHELLERDQLTGLYNMRAFSMHMQELMQRNPSKKYVLVRFDIDNFKAFNDTQGAKTGDELLKGIGQGIEGAANLSNRTLLCGYLGADHFVILTEESKYTQNPEKLHERILQFIKEQFSGYYLSISMGMCKIDDIGADSSRYYDRSLIALRSIKNDYYSHWAWYDDEIQAAVEAENLITEKMHGALEEGRFVPFFQPQYDYASGKICGAEVLARWIDADGKMLSPGQFIPVFEKNGFIYEMDKAIWKAACKCIKEWKSAGIMPPHLSINISRTDIYHTDLVDTLLDILSDHEVDIAELHLEITESSYLENSALLIKTVDDFKAVGAYLEMDDFGSGYSSLSSLKNIAVDLIKLDMSWLANNSLEGKDGALLSSIIQLAKQMNIDIIAEGVEYENQAEYLHSLGCDKMQGFLFSRPLSRESFEELMLKNK